MRELERDDNWRIWPYPEKVLWFPLVPHMQRSNLLGKRVPLKTMGRRRVALIGQFQSRVAAPVKDDGAKECVRISIDGYEYELEFQNSTQPRLTRHG